MSDFADTRVSLAGRGAVVGMAASTVSSGTASVTVGDVTVTAYTARGLTLAVGDPVLIVRSGSRYYVTSLLRASAPASPELPDPAPVPNPPAVAGVLVVSPTTTATYRDSAWLTGEDATYQGSYGAFGLNTGVAFYGTKPRSLTGATVLGATLAVRRMAGGTYTTQTSTLWLITESAQPVGAPTRTSSTTGPALNVSETDVDFTIPTAWAQAIVDGTSGALAIYDADGDPYMKLAGRQAWASAWTLRITWSR